MANQFEKEFEEKFPIIQKTTGAFLFRLYPPMRVGAMRGSMPCWVQTGRALFDVGGWWPLKLPDDAPNIATHPQGNLDLGSMVAVAIGIALKSNKDAHYSMPIIGDDGTGSGLQAHQLAALASVHRNGGISRVLWNNGGIVGVLDGDRIASIHFNYGVSVEAEKLRMKPARGSRSIPWSLFRRIKWEEHPESVLLAPVKALTIKQELALSKRRIRHKSEAASVEADPEVINPLVME